MASKQCLSDIQTDAVIDSERISELYAHSSVSQLSSRSSNPENIGLSSSKPFSSGTSNVQPQSSLAYAQSARPIVLDENDGKEYLNFLGHMPPHLQEPNVDILIINAENDRKDALNFKMHLEKDILFYIHEEARRPRVKLLEDIRYGSMDNLDLAFSKALYVFLYVTREFCDAPWTLLQGQACLTEAIHDKDKKWCVVPIHTCSKKSKRYKLPMMLNSLRPINYWSGDEDQFYVEGVKKLLESKTGLLLQRERELDEERQTWFNKNRSDIMKNFQHMKSASYPSITCYASQVTNASSPILCTSHIQEETQTPPKSSVTIPDDGISSDIHSSSLRYDSFPVPCDDKASPDECQADLQRRVNEMGMSEQSEISPNNSLAIRLQASHASDGQPASSDIDRGQRHRHQVQQSTVSDQRSLHNINVTSPGSSQHHVSVTSVQSSQHNVMVNQPMASIPFSSVVVDGPANVDLPSQPAGPNTSGEVTNMVQTVPVSSAQLGLTSSVPSGTVQSMHPGAIASAQIGTSFAQSQGGGTHIPSHSVVYHLGRPYQITQSGQLEPLFTHQPFYQSGFHMSDPNLHQSMPYYPPPAVPYYIPPYAYANYFPPPSYPSSFMPPSSQGSQPTSHMESPMTSTEAYASSSYGPRLPHSLSVGAVNSGPYSFVNQWPSPLPPQHPLPGYLAFPPQVSQAARQHFTATNTPRQQGETSQLDSSLRQNQPSHVPFPSVDETSVKGQFDSMGKAEEKAPTVSAGPMTSTTASGTGNVVQHVHHHHHKKEIRVERATNVLIGDRSQFLNRTASSNVVGDEDKKSSDDDSGSDVSDIEAQPTAATAVTTNRRGKQLHTKVPQDQSIPSADGGGASRVSQPNTSASDSSVSKQENMGDVKDEPNASMGFPECVQPASTRHPEEVSDIPDALDEDEQNQTYPKKLPL